MEVQKRHLITFLMTLGYVTLYCLRTNLSIAIVAMVKLVPNGNESANGDNDQCFYPLDTAMENSTDTQVDKVGTFDWDEYTQGLVLGSFYYGYVVANFFGGYLSERFGGKWVNGLGVLTTSLLTLLSEPVANLGYQYFMVLRLLEGLTEGVCLPAMHTLSSKWFPVTESAFLFSFLQAGSRLGTVIAIPISAYLCNTPFGWPLAFYVFGAVGAVWSILWFLLTHEHPSDHPYISTEELLLITQNKLSKEGLIKCKVPWKQLLLSWPLWVVIVANFGVNWTFNVFLLDAPTFLKYILKFDLETNGLLSSLPYLLATVAFIFAGYLSKLLISKEWLSITNTRKLMQVIGTIGPTFTVLGIVLARCDRMLVLVFIYLGEIFQTFGSIGTLVSLLDLAPAFAGTLMGLTNGVANLSGIFVPMMIGALTNNNQTLTQWHIVFYFDMAINVFCCFLYVLFGHSNIQPWATEYLNPTPRHVEESKL